MSERPLTVKICGVRTLECAQAAIDAGADMLGFICYPPARRYLAPERIADILGQVRGRASIRAVGVFVNQPVAAINALAATCGLDLVQLSGDEPVELVAEIERPVIKAWRRASLPAPDHEWSGYAGEAGSSRLGAPGKVTVSPKPPERETHSAPFTGLHKRSPTIHGRARLHALLLEPPSSGWGGAGRQLDWQLARAITALADRPAVILAGGLTPENVADAITAVRPDGVDVSSGVETDGVQDHARIAAFVAAAKGAPR